MSEQKTLVKKKKYIPEPTSYPAKCPACGKFTTYGKLSEDYNEFALVGYRCKCGWNSEGR